ncbi:MAG: hypothetical protein ACRDGU_02450 [Actinomycetota bacterium]
MHLSHAPAGFLDLSLQSPDLVFRPGDVAQDDVDLAGKNARLSFETVDGSALLAETGNDGSISLLVSSILLLVSARAEPTTIDAASMTSADRTNAARADTPGRITMGSRL